MRTADGCPLVIFEYSVIARERSDRGNLLIISPDRGIVTAAKLPRNDTVFLGGLPRPVGPRNDNNLLGKV